MQFSDNCKLIIEAGNGGDGALAWRREAHYPEGGPWGGEGGSGGNVILVGDYNLNSLFHLRYLKKVSAQDGENGQTKLCSGRNGIDEIVHVPLGTQVFNAITNELIVDILNNNQTYTIANGGKGGHGNAYFKSAVNKTPTFYERGDKGEKLTIELKLKYIADIGLVGLPNAGKSSLITVLSNARPKIASYQFTTLTPVLGTMKINEESSVVIADIPGIIEGASENKGLGFEFLKHIERCHTLIHVISLDKNDHENIIHAYETIRNELNKYSYELLSKTQLIVANKIDAEGAKEQLAKLKAYLPNEKIITISALEKNNIDELKNEIVLINTNYVEKMKRESVENELKVIELKQEKEIDKSFKFEQLDEHRWLIKSKYLTYWINKIPLNTKDNVWRFNQKLNNCNVDEILKSHGAKSKDTIIIENVEFELD